MQPYFDPTRKKTSKKRKTTSKKMKKMEDNLKNFLKNGRRPQKKNLQELEWRPQKNGRWPKKNGRRPKKKEGKKKGRRPKQKWQTNQSTKINLIGCDTIVNSPSSVICYRKINVSSSTFHFSGFQDWDIEIYHVNLEITLCTNF
jgi:hypothetical protein